MVKEKQKKSLEISIQAAIEAGKAIMQIYDTDFYVEQKADESPLTQADKNAHNIIAKKLEQTDYPILSEEGKNIPYPERKEWNTFWLVDPLDGTKEFVNRNGEFTVNIALIENQSPVAGVVYVPVTKELYFASETYGSWKLDKKGLTENQFDIDLDKLTGLAVELPPKHERKTIAVVGSRSHMNDKTRRFIDKLKEKYQEIDIVSKGSSLKFCMIAEGKADVYPRYAPTMEWDTGAGHAIAKFMGASITQAGEQGELIYNKQELLNPEFLVKAPGMVV